MEITCYFILGIFHRTDAPLHIQIIMNLLSIFMNFQKKSLQQRQIKFAKLLTVGIARKNVIKLRTESVKFLEIYFIMKL